MHGELAVGRVFGKKDFYPYIDLRTAITITFVDVGMQLDAIGFAGKTTYQRVDFALGPRVGCIVPLGSVFFLDGAVQYGILGPERFAATAGLGVWFTGEPRE
jgi:hypothetical protein